VKKKKDMKTSDIFNFLQEANGNSSSIRILMIAYGFGILLVWVVLSIKTGTVLEIPDSILMALVAVISGKVISKPLEEKVCEVPKIEEVKQ
jgi:hypothetical protein